VPVEAVNVCPTCDGPEIEGAAVFEGGKPATAAVCGEVAADEPPAFVAVTTTRTVPATSDAFSRYVGLVAPAISTQVLPPPSQSRHRYPNELGLPVQSPTDAVSVCPSRGVPEIAGSATFAGAATAAVTTVVGCELAAAEPPALVAVTTTRRVLPTSEACNTYVASVAPAMSRQLAPLASQSRHR
jgi:hypothetical protein